MDCASCAFATRELMLLIGLPLMSNVKSPMCTMRTMQRGLCAARFASTRVYFTPSKSLELCRRRVPLGLEHSSAVCLFTTSQSIKGLRTNCLCSQYTAPGSPEPVLQARAMYRDNTAALSGGHNLRPTSEPRRSRGRSIWLGSSPCSSRTSRSSYLTYPENVRWRSRRRPRRGDGRSSLGCLCSCLTHGVVY